MADIEEELELQRLNEQIELVTKKLEEANAKLQNIQKQCNGLRSHFQHSNKIIRSI